MKRYLIQIRNYTSPDSERRVYRFIMEALNLVSLAQQLNDHGWIQFEIDILASEETK